MEPSYQYRSFLLRLWCSGDGKTWRAMVEEVGSHERHHFADLEGLCAFLQKQTEPDGGPAPSDGIALRTAGGNPGRD